MTSRDSLWQKKIAYYSYNIRDKLGEGNYAQVFKGVNDETNERVAIKLIDRTKITDEVG